MVTHARVFSLIPTITITPHQGMFIVSSLTFLRYQFGYDNMCSWEKIKDMKILLPRCSKSEIDFDFMEKFVRELEALRLRELEAYLQATGLNNYELTSEDIQSLRRFDIICWKKFKMEDLFEKVTTKKLHYKAKILPKQPTSEYTLPCLTSSFINQGLNYYVPREKATILKNVISIPSNSDVYRAYYQSKEFTILSDAYAIRWKDKVAEIEPKLYLFMLVCINKFTDLPIYSYKNKLGGWNIVKEKDVLLPVNNEGEIDFDAMEQLIGAIQKLVIKEVAQYTARRINTTRTVIDNNI